ncbi:hypothetical protein [Sphingosinicella sp.]|jgi:hypothetical protein|uniref:hypothetical protein n=1 Tax=Sphingosinicella sp. TaxID=1917971 RepID=UPI0035ADCFC5
MDASAAPSTAAFSPSFPASSLFPQAVAAKAIATENPKTARFDMLPIVLPRHFLVAAVFFHRFARNLTAFRHRLKASWARTVPWLMAR